MPMYLLSSCARHSFHSCSCQRGTLLCMQKRKRLTDTATPAPSKRRRNQTGQVSPLICFALESLPTPVPLELHVCYAALLMLSIESRLG